MCLKLNHHTVFLSWWTLQSDQHNHCMRACQVKSSFFKFNFSCKAAQQSLYSAQFSSSLALIRDFQCCQISNISEYVLSRVPFIPVCGDLPWREDWLFPRWYPSSSWRHEGSQAHDISSGAASPEPHVWQGEPSLRSNAVVFCALSFTQMCLIPSVLDFLKSNHSYNLDTICTVKSVNL